MSMIEIFRDHSFFVSVEPVSLAPPCSKGLESARHRICISLT